MSQERYIKIVPPKNYIFRSLDITFKLRPFLFLLFLSSHKRAKIFSYSIDYKIFLIENFMEEWSHPSFYVKDWKVLQIWDFAPEWNGLKIFENHTNIWMLLVFQNWTKPKVGFLKSYVTCFEKFLKRGLSSILLNLNCSFTVNQRETETEQKRIFDFIGKKCQLTKEKSYLRFLKKRFGKEASWPFKAKKHDLKKNKNNAICLFHWGAQISDLIKMYAKLQPLPI